ncbi:MAG TPA: type II toxin-antitoxin system VapC family toxin [Blastocatellia bacterium]|nr:type II toxin-antitoxin system VapC family toxin [Blastocatellia bacterium]
MGEVVLDASAVLALLNQEPGGDRVETYLGEGVLSAVNAAEVLSKLVDGGLTTPEAKESLLLLGLRIVDFDSYDAEIVASLRTRTKPKGLSLGDRACLGLGLRLDALVVTAEKSWASLEITEIATIR